jgi:hypothetical protein
MRIIPVISSAVSIIAIGVPIGAANAQSFSPPPHVHYEPPLRSRVTQVHQCPSGPVTIEVSGVWDLGSKGSIRVESYSGGAGPASADDLKVWNDWLAELGALGSVELVCQTSNNERITIRGRNWGGPSGSVTVWWWQGQLGRSF